MLVAVRLMFSEGNVVVPGHQHNLLRLYLQSGGQILQKGKRIRQQDVSFSPSRKVTRNHHNTDRGSRKLVDICHERVQQRAACRSGFQRKAEIRTEVKIGQVDYAASPNFQLLAHEGAWGDRGRPRPKDREKSSVPKRYLTEGAAEGLPLDLLESVNFDPCCDRRISVITRRACILGRSDAVSRRPEQDIARYGSEEARGRAVEDTDGDRLSAEEGLQLFQLIDMTSLICLPPPTPPDITGSSDDLLVSTNRICACNVTESENYRTHHGLFPRLGSSLGRMSRNRILRSASKSAAPTMSAISLPLAASAEIFASWSTNLMGSDELRPCPLEVSTLRISLSGSRRLGDANRWPLAGRDSTPAPGMEALVSTKNRIVFTSTSIQLRLRSGNSGRGNACSIDASSSSSTIKKSAIFHDPRSWRSKCSRNGCSKVGITYSTKSSRTKSSEEQDFSRASNSSRCVAAAGRVNSGKSGKNTVPPGAICATRLNHRS